MTRTRRRFGSWMQGLGSDPRGEIYLLASQALKRGMSYAVKYCAGAPAVARATPPAGSAAPVSKSPRRIAGWAHRTINYWAMRRHRRTCIVDLTEMSCCLVSDSGVDFKFCDAGEIQFWIDAVDLAARRFDRIWANTKGG